MDKIACPFCGEKHDQRAPLMNIICAGCNAKYYGIGGFWLNRETGEKRYLEDTIMYKEEELTADDILEPAKESLGDLVIKARKTAIREGIAANAIVLNENLVKVSGAIGMWPDMICGLKVYWDKNELPEDYSFAVCHDIRIDDPVEKAYQLVCDILDGKKDDTYLEEVRGYLGQALDA